MCSNGRLPEELWRRILELGVIESSTLNYRDVSSLSITSTLLNRLSSENALWNHLLSTDFPPSSSTTSSTQQQQHPTDSKPSPKSIYKFRFEKDKARKLLAHRRAILRIESQISDHLRKLREIELQLTEEIKKMKATLEELSNLQKVRQASVALNVWQPEAIRARQNQIVQNCAVSVDSRIRAVEMELKLCNQQIAGFHKARRVEKRRLEAAKEQLAPLRYHPFQSPNAPSSSLDDCKMKPKKFKTCIDCEDLTHFFSCQFFQECVLDTSFFMINAKVCYAWLVDRLHFCEYLERFNHLHVEVSLLATAWHFRCFKQILNNQHSLTGIMISASPKRLAGKGSFCNNETCG